ncbi:neutral amino acid permease [Diplodia corticola]|uniref:Neutral amino acid permease n=1 Tax=Diplodia corticola TaxID=236234 RepID=A0A1J9QS31_9PEZI|nr:neutral amino acid permease [Diplodia corticola]OJD30802.1 neutral amino acid permease [Diplodia corticola]
MENDSREDRLQELWEEVLAEYEKITDEPLQDRHVLSVDEMRVKLDEISQAEKGEIIKKSAEAVCSVASAASSVLPYASIVLDALSALGNTAQGYNENFTKKHVLEHFKSVAWNLDRIEGYMKLVNEGFELDATLQTTIVQLFTGMLMLCKIYRKVDKDSETLSGPIKNTLKAAIRYDGGLKSYLNEIKDATDRELRNNVAALRVSAIYANSERNSEKLRQVLQIEPNNHPWIGRRDSLDKQHIKGMGDWLYEHPHFRSWADVEDDTRPILLLNGERGSGKTFLCAQAIRILEEKHKSQTPNGRASIAWFFFPETDARQKDLHSEGVQGAKQQLYDGKGKSSLRDALFALVWQMAQANRSFQSFAVTRFNARPHGFSKAMDIWTELIFKFIKDLKQAVDSSKVFFLVLDVCKQPTNGTDEEEEALSRIIRDTKSQKKGALIRILLSGDMNRQELNKSTWRPDLTHQQYDAEIFVEGRLKQCYERWTREPEGGRVLRALQSLAISDFEGTYHVLDASLDEIIKARGLRDLRELKKRGLGLLRATERHLGMLSEELSDEELKDSNEMITCLVCFKDAELTLDQLKAYLYIRRGERAATSIESQIRKLPPWLISITDEGHVISPGIIKLFDGKEKEPKPSDRGQNQGGYDTPADIVDSTNHGTERSNTPPGTFIFNLQSRVNMILSLLEAVCRTRYRRHADLTCLYKHAATQLLRCFEMIPKEQLVQTEKRTKKKIGKRLHQFFMDEEVVETWLPEGDIDELLGKGKKKELLGTLTKKVLEWLEDQDVRSGFQKSIDRSPQSEGPRTFQSFVSPLINPARLLHAPVKIIAYQWLREHNWNALSALKFLNEVSSKAELELSPRRKPHSRGEEVLEVQRSNGKCPRDTSSPIGDSFKDEPCSESESSFKSESSSDESELTFPFEKNDFSRKHVEVAKNWAMKLVGITKRQAHRNPTQDVRLAETYFELKHYDKARQRCEFAKMRDPWNLRATLCLSRVMECTDRRKKALEELMKIRHSIQSPKFREQNRQEWQHQLDRLWRLCDETNSAKEAFTVCRYLARTFPNDPTVLFLDKAFEWMEKSKTLTDVIGSLSMPIGMQNNRSLLTLLFLSSPASPEFHERFYLALKDSKDKIFRAYEDAITASDDALKTIHLRYYYGLSLLYQQEVTEARDQWEMCIASIRTAQKDSPTPESIFEIFSMVVHGLVLAYIDVLKGDKGKKAHEYTEKMEKHKSWADRNYPLKANYLALLLAPLYRVSGHHKKARLSVEKHMASAFELLKDGEEDNDGSGYFMLAEALLVLADDDNARAAWSIIVNEPDAEWTSNLSIACAGGCGWTWADSKTEGREVYICKDCAHVHFEKNCHDRLQKGKLDRRVCGKRHDFLTVPKRKGKDVTKIQNGTVLVGHVEMRTKDWVNGVRYKYGIRKPGLTWPKRAVESLHIAKSEVERGLNTAKWIAGSLEDKL